MCTMIVVMLSLRTLYTQRDINTQSSISKFKRCIWLRESQQSPIRTAKGVLGDKARALSLIHAPSEFMRRTLASATYTYLLDVFSLPDEVSESPSCTTNLHFFALSVFDVLSLESLL